MKTTKEKTKSSANKADDTKKASTEGYPLYPPGEDVYNNLKEETDIDPEDVTKIKRTDEINTKEERNEKGFEDDESGDDLDVPGSELDDEQERIGSEDEENNYYSLGGDDHNDLDEDKGDE
jgi:hypothetical protein